MKPRYGNERLKRAPAGSVGRADFLLARAVAGPGHDDVLAAACGLGRRGPGASRPDFLMKSASKKTEQAVESQPEPKPIRATRKLSFLIPRRYRQFVDETFVEPEPVFAERAIRADELRARPLPTRFEPLTPWRRVWPWLRRALSHFRSSPDIDVPRLIDDLAHLRPLQHLPRRQRLHWTPRVHIWIDGDPEMDPFQPDVGRLVDGLRGLRGFEGLCCFVLPAGPGRLDRAVDVHTDKIGRPPAPHHGEPVLALSALGCFQGRRLKAWVECGLHLRRQGALLLALSPCPSRRWEPRGARVWNCRQWDRHIRIRPNSCDAPTDAVLRDATYKAKLEALLQACSVALRVDPPLLRELRLAVPGADAGLEHDVWFHPAVARSSTACAVSFSAGPSYRDEFKLGGNEYAIRLRKILPALLERHHGGYGASLRALETSNCIRVGLEVGKKQETESSLSAKRCNQARFDWLRERRNGADPLDLEQWHLRKFARLSPAERAEDAELAEACAIEDWIGKRSGEPSEGIDLDVYKQTLRSLRRWGGRLDRWTLRQQGGKLHLRPLHDKRTFGQPIGTLYARSPQFTLLPQKSWPSKEWVETDTSAILLESHAPPSWASCFGWDQIGLYVEFEINAAAFKLRWIPPGIFNMGSPEDEPGRYDDEGPRHRVTIERGYWMGCTPVTRGQYLAVTGDNPSHFENAGLDAPVETVSWEDATNFCRKLTGLVEGLETGATFRLPSEAEWEYACRAGAETALYTGPITIKGQNNAPELNEMAWYGGNSEVDYEGGVDSSDWPEKQYAHDKAGTHPVRKKQPNAWGLYDMLGNVWEWCHDQWHDTYEDAPKDAAPWIDDEADKGLMRVIRGGSWNFNARYCRAACRDRDRPDYRYDNVGFRLVLAPSSTGQTAPSLEQGGKAPGRRPPNPVRSRGGGRAPTEAPGDRG